MIFRAILAIAALFFSVPAFAADPVPGSACGTGNLITNSFQWAGAPENGGVLNGMFCDGAHWKGIINFQSSGYLGIGTTSPGATLDVAGNLKATYATSGGTAITGIANIGAGIGILGATASTITNAVGIYGSASGASGATYGIFGTDASATGFGGYFTNTNGGYALVTGSGNVGIGTTSPGALLDIGKATSTLGTMRLEGNTSGYVQIQPTAAAGSWTMTLPNSAGTSGYVLSTDGSGNLSWISGGGSTALSGLTNAAATKTLANANYAQVWNWDTLTTGTALTLGSTSMTTGHILTVANTHTSGAGAPFSASTQSVTNNAMAVFGWAEGGTGATRGVYGENDSATTGAAGVMGWVGAGATEGVYGETDSTTNDSSGVYGDATAATGATYGVQGTTSSTNPATAGVYGTANAATGATRGVYGENDSSTAGASGVMGWVGAGATYGVFGEADGATTNATGVYGNATHATGVIYGVQGETDSATAGSAGVYGWTSTATGATYAVYGSDASSTGFGGYFTNTNGGYALATGSGKVGIGTNSPATKLDVNGTIRFAYGGESCSASTVGGLYYSSATQLMYGCLTAGSWTQIATGSGSVSTRRTCMIIIGADNGGALANADIAPQGQQCYVPAASTIVEINIRADGGTPNVLLQRRRGAATVADLASAVLATAASGGAACAMSTTSQTCLDGTTSSGTVTLSNTGLNAGDWIETKSATAGGTAKRLSIAVVYTVN